MLAASVLVVIFAGASLLADTLRPRWRPVPLLLLGASMFFAMLELTRFDHGHGEAYWLLSMVIAPIVLIFGGAAWGTRRFYGWPDLGDHPSRAAFIALCMLLGVLIGGRLQAEDIQASQQTAQEVRSALLAWRDAHEGAYPLRLDEAVSPVPRTSLGMIAPPPFAYGLDADGMPLLAIPVRTASWLALDVDKGTWAVRGTPLRPFPASR